MTDKSADKILCVDDENNILYLDRQLNLHTAGSSAKTLPPQCDGISLFKLNLPRITNALEHT